WILSIDADERVTPELAAEIKEALKGPKADAYSVPRHVFYLGRWINHSGWYPDRKIRLFRRDKGRWGGIDPHDTVIVSGEVNCLKGDLIHYSFRDIAHHINTMNSFTTIASKEYVKLGKRFRLTDILFRPVFMFFKSYVLKQGFRDGLPGLVIAVAAAYHVFIKYAKLWELRNTNRRDAETQRND
ncbi:MAG: glycosyltransferase family 2 protein, partial [Deltaproteobacteria bacterium]|nr:glycosyltransferase family 2 protein [Deltaproteobacteria bacterium]